MSAKEESISMKNKYDNSDRDKASGLKYRKFSLFVLLAGSLWGFMGLLVRSLNAVGLTSMEICFIRGAVTFVVMLAGLLLFDRKALRIKLKDIWCFVGTGAFSVAFFNFCYFKTMTLTSLSVAAVLLYTAPAFVMLMSAVLFKESPGRVPVMGRP